MNIPLILIFILVVKALAMIGIIQFSGIGLGPDEAQYWTWSQYLDWGYYSKPPGIAWEIWFGTKLFGNTELGVRFGAIVISFFMSISTYYLAKACRLKPQIAFWSAIIMAFSPLGLFASFFAITDGGMVLFWILASVIVADSLSLERKPNYLLLGVVILCGALFKWTMFYFWIFIFGLMPLYPSLRDYKSIYGVIISLAGLLPSFIWNYSHDWATFRHVGATIVVEKPLNTHSQGNFLEFLGSQSALLSPILFIMLLIAAYYLIKEWKKIPLSLQFCALLCYTTLSFFLILSLFKKIQGNWCDFAYPSGIVFLSWWGYERINGRKWLVAGLVVSIFLSIFTFMVPYIQSHRLIQNFTIPYKINPFKHNLGWNPLKSELENIGYDKDKEFLFGDKYQMSSILSFYSPGQKRAYFFNLHGIRKNQFSYWPSMAEEQTGRTGFFVLVENTPHLEKDTMKRIQDYEDMLSNYFKEIQFLGIKTLFENNNTPVKGAFIFKCIEYNGKKPFENELY